jgi:hypothetical protein
MRHLKMGRGNFSPDDHGVPSGLLRSASQNFGLGLGHVLGIGILGAAIGAVGTLALTTVPDTTFAWHDEQGRPAHGIRRSDTQLRLDRALQKIGELEGHAKARSYRNTSGPHASHYVRAKPSQYAPVLKTIPDGAGEIASPCNIEVVGGVVLVEADYQGQRGWVIARWLAPSR